MHTGIKNKATGIFLSLVLCIPVFIPASAQAQGSVISGLFPCSGTEAVPGQTDGSMSENDRECTFGDLVSGVQGIATSIVKVGLLVAPVILAYVGYLFLTSGGNAGVRKKAAGIAKNVVIGLAIMISAWVVVNFVLTTLVCQSVFSAGGFPFAAQGGSTGPGCK